MNNPFTPEPIDMRVYYDRRISEIPDAIRIIARHNALVMRLIEMYARMEIVTIQELLCQMVIGLSKTNRELFDDLIQRKSSGF